MATQFQEGGLVNIFFLLDSAILGVLYQNDADMLVLYGSQIRCRSLGF
jgi:hypothetical protein